MRFEALETFRMVASQGSISAAAKSCYLSQPAVSTSVSMLEKELGKTLLVRTSGQRTPLKLTDEGTIFVDFARKALADFNKMKSSLLAVNTELEPFTLGMSHTPSNLILPTLVSSFRSTYPDISFKVRTFPGYEMQNKLANSECDIVITSVAPSDRDFVCERFFYDPLVLIAPKALSLRGPISPKELSKLPLVTREDNCNITKILTAAFRRVKMSLSDMRVVLQVYGNDAVMQAVSLGTGVGFVTKSLLAGFQGERNFEEIGVRSLKLDRYLHLIRRANTQHAGVMLFWDFTRQMTWREYVFSFDTGAV